MGSVGESVPLLVRKEKRIIPKYLYVEIFNRLAPKIKEVDGPDVVLLESVRRVKYFRLSKVINRSAISIQTMIDEPLPINGARLFNSLPRCLGECDGTLDTFKNHHSWSICHHSWRIEISIAEV